MPISRRSTLKILTAGTAVGLLRGRGSASESAPLPPSIMALSSMRADAKPITVDERRGRIERAQQLMSAHRIDAIFLAGGASLSYFTGMRWGNSERLFACVIPAKGQSLLRVSGV